MDGSRMEGAEGVGQRASESEERGCRSSCLPEQNPANVGKLHIIHQLLNESLGPRSGNIVRILNNFICLEFYLSAEVFVARSFEKMVPNLE
ncbi:hypothetical protein CDAR_558931 [Caerostris darwini]|uniref:Uncharacterized protein n=1 Tax=Caerostris darwini TaxID=1538125 RepID=A0AAV4NB87_9ARAC|nr:hypothetical protein CDAR_558931 [Caerostris darwini]